VAKIIVHAGDFGAGNASLLLGSLSLPNGAKRSISSLASVDMANQQTVKKLFPTLGWGAAGTLLLGPLGLLTGVLVGGRRNEVSFVAAFGDGKRFFATTDGKTFIQLQSQVFNRVQPTPQESSAPKVPDSSIEQPPNPAHSPSGDDATSVLEQAGWRSKQQPQPLGQRFKLYRATGFNAEIVVAWSPDAVTDYSFDQMARALEGISAKDGKLIVGKSVGVTVARRAKGSGIILTDFDGVSAALAEL